MRLSREYVDYQDDYFRMFCSRCYAKHGPPFLVPVVREEEYKAKAEEGALEQYEFAKVAPAKTIDSSSPFQDDLVK